MLFYLKKGLGTLATTVRMGHAQNDRAYAARLVRHIGRAGWGNLNRVEMPTIANAIESSSTPELLPADRHGPPQCG